MLQIRRQLGARALGVLQHRPVINLETCSGEALPLSEGQRGGQTIWLPSLPSLLPPYLSYTRPLPSTPAASSSISSPSFPLLPGVKGLCPSCQGPGFWPRKLFWKFACDLVQLGACCPHSVKVQTTLYGKGTLTNLILFCCQPRSVMHYKRLQAKKKLNWKVRNVVQMVKLGNSDVEPGMGCILLCFK
jgi:hypothetical protein